MNYTAVHPLPRLSRARAALTTFKMNTSVKLPRKMSLFLVNSFVFNKARFAQILLSPFRMNTYRTPISVHSKRLTRNLSTFRMNTYKNVGGRGYLNTNGRGRRPASASPCIPDLASYPNFTSPLYFRPAVSPGIPRSHDEHGVDLGHHVGSLSSTRPLRRTSRQSQVAKIASPVASSCFLTKPFSPRRI